jgi:CRP-like cAMP-binding protein
MNRYVTIDHALGEEQQQLHAEADIPEDLPQAEVEYVATRCPIVRLRKKESLTLDEDPHGITWLVSGRVRVHEPALGGQELTFSVAEGGTLVGQLGFISRSSRSLRVEALEASILRFIRWVDFRDLVLRNTEVGVKTMRLLSERLGAYEGRLSDLIRKEVRAWLANVRLFPADRGPEDIAPAADGSMWFTRSTAGNIARITPSGVITIQSKAVKGEPLGITVAPNGDPWFTRLSSDKIATFQLR